MLFGLEWFRREPKKDDEVGSGERGGCHPPSGHLEFDAMGFVIHFAVKPRFLALLEIDGKTEAAHFTNRRGGWGPGSK